MFGKSNLANENVYKRVAIELFQDMEYKHVYGADFERDFYSLLYDVVLKIYLCEIKPNCDEHKFLSIKIAFSFPMFNL